MFKYKPQLLFHHTARFPWHPLFVNSSSPSLQCQECPRSILSGMCPVRTTPPTPYPSCSIPRSKELSSNHPKGGSSNEQEKNVGVKNARNQRLSAFISGKAYFLIAEIGSEGDRRAFGAPTLRQQ